MNIKLLSILSIFLLSPLFFVSASDIDVSFKGANMVFKTDVSSRTDLTYASQDGKVKVNLKGNSFRQSHNIQLWNLDFTSFNYILKLTDSNGNLTQKEGSFTVVPADPTLIKKTEVAQPTLYDMSREELISLLDKLLRK